MAIVATDYPELCNAAAADATMPEASLSCSRKRKRCIDDYDRLQCIGFGSYGSVYKARHIPSGEIVAIKQVKLEGNSVPITTSREINFLMSYPHPSIVAFKEAFIDRSVTRSMYFAMEFADRDLQSELDARDNPFSEGEVKKLMFQLLDGVAYLHAHSVMHRDLKPNNLLLTDGGHQLKICDFGLSTWWDGEEPLSLWVVSLWYRAPELLLGFKKYTAAIDIWSVGCIMAELLAKEVLFRGTSEVDQVHRILTLLGTPDRKEAPEMLAKVVAEVGAPYERRRRSKLRAHFPHRPVLGRPALSRDGFDLLRKMLEYDPERRIKAEDALRHAWFNELRSSC